MNGLTWDAFADLTIYAAGIGFGAAAGWTVLKSLVGLVK